MHVGRRHRHSVDISEFFPTQILCTFCQNYKLFTNHENKSSSWESSRLAAKNWSSEINSVDSNAQTRPLKAQLWFIFDVRQVRKLPTIHRKNQYHQLWSTYFKSWWDWFLRKIVGNFRTCRTSIKNRNCAFKGRVRASPLSRPFLQWPSLHCQYCKCEWKLMDFIGGTVLKI